MCYDLLLHCIKVHVSYTCSSIMSHAVLYYICMLYFIVAIEGPPLKDIDFNAIIDNFKPKK